MKTYARLNDLPGPGDPETWGPCTGHPLDPRTEDETALYDAVVERIFSERMEDLSWFMDAFSEAGPELYAPLHSAYQAHDGEALVKALFDIAYAYMTPTETDIQHRLAFERDADDARMEDKWDAERDLL